MKIAKWSAIVAVTLSSVSVLAYNGPRRGGPVGGPQFRPPGAGPQFHRPPVAGPQFRRPPGAGPQFHRPPVAGPQFHRPPVAGPQFHRPPVFRPPMRPPVMRPPHWHPPAVRPPVYRPPIGHPGYPPPILPPPIVEPVIPVYPDPGYPVPNPIPDPIEEQGIYGLPAHLYVQDPCDPMQFQVPVINTVPAQSVYCSPAYVNRCQQMFNGYQVYPYNVGGPGHCQIRPTYNGTLVLIVNNSTVLAERQSEQSIGVAYRNARVMGICQ